MEKQIVEINGIKLELDMRQATRIDTFKVGDNVKILIKNYGDSYNTYPGVIISFDNFAELPTICVCYVDINYSSAEIKFININASTKGHEIIHMAEHEKRIDKRHAIDLLDRVILTKSTELQELERKRAFFLEKYNMHFETPINNQGA